MGQYFMLVNLDKKEYVRPWDIGGVGKLCEWCGNPQAGVIPFLLAQGPDDGVLGGTERYLTERDTGVRPPHPEWGRWAGDRVVLIGDYDDSELYKKAEAEFENISEWLVAEFNEFMGFDITKEPTRFMRPDMILGATGLRTGRDAVERR